MLATARGADSAEPLAAPIQPKPTFYIVEIKDKLGTLLFWYESVPIGFHSQRPDIVRVKLNFSKAFLVGAPLAHKIRPLEG
jgi:hypothetical protein